LLLLDLSMNKLDTLDGISIVNNIKELWVDYNLLNEEFEIKDLVNLPLLECVRLNYNEICKKYDINEILLKMKKDLKEINGDVLNHKINV